MRWAGREARARVVLHRRGMSTIRSHVWTTTDTCLILPRQAQDDQLTSLPFQYCRMDFVPVGGRSCGTVPQRHRSDAFRCEKTLMPLLPIALCSCRACLGKSSCVFLPPENSINAMCYAGKWEAWFAAKGHPYLLGDSPSAPDFPLCASSSS